MDKRLVLWSLVIIIVTALIVLFLLLVFIKTYTPRNIPKLTARLGKIDSSLVEDDYISLEKSRLIEMKQDAKIGRTHSRKHSIVFSCILQDGIDYATSIARMISLGKEFQEMHILVAKKVDKSTPDLDRLDFVTCIEFPQDYEIETKSSTDPDRSFAIAAIRNQLLELALEQFRHYDYYCVFSTTLDSYFCEDAFFSNFSFTGWHAIFCNGLIKRIVSEDYVDYTVANPEFMIIDEEEFCSITSKRFKLKISETMQPLPRDTGMIRMRSAFGGCTVYPLRCLQNCRYDGRFYDHLSLHKSMYSQGYDRMFLNTDWIVFYF